MSLRKHNKVTTLRKHLFYRGQVYFQIIAACALIVGTAALGWVFHEYQIPDYLLKIVLLVGFSLTLMVIGLQAYLQHKIVSEAVGPVSWLSCELHDLLSKISNEQSSKPANISDLESGIASMLKLLEEHAVQQQEIKNLAQTLRHLIDLLYRYWQAATRNEVLAGMGRVSAEVAHDLKSPLSSLQVASQYFKEIRTDDPRFEDHLNLLILSHNRLTTIVNNLLLKYKGGREEKSVFSIHPLLDELVAEYQLQERFGAIRFVKEYCKHDVSVEGSRQEIQRLFGNLIKNAAEAMHFAGKLSLRSRHAEEKVTVEVEDTGHGIPGNKLESIFRGDSGKKGGHGIGLQFVKRTALAHGGMVWVESMFGEGSRFSVELPASKTSDTVFSVNIEKEEPVFVIDDDASMLEQWRMALEENGVKAVLCESWENFITVHPEPVEGCHQTAIIDYHFDNSEVNGIEIIRRLKERGFKNLYLCTAEYWKPSVQKEAKELGVTVCPKPLPKIVICHSELHCHPERSEGSPIVAQEILRLMPQDDKGKEGYTVLVIDDDKAIRMAWGLMKGKLGIAKLHCFPNLEAAQSVGVDIAAVDIAFVDKNIEHSAFSGAEVIGWLKQKGAVKVVLASGESEEALRADPALAQADFIVNEKIPDSLERITQKNSGC